LTVNLYDRLFNHPNPEADKEIAFTTQLNPNSLVVVTSAIAEPSIAKSSPGDHFQFEREGYFCVDIDSCKQRIIVNRTLPLKDSWVKINS
jgi:glutaminyl-tRNA synthetase